MLKSIKLLFLLIIIGTSDVVASHYMGGEITWQCLANGNFRFIMKLYRECNGVTFNGDMRTDSSKLSRFDYNNDEFKTRGKST